LSGIFFFLLASFFLFSEFRGLTDFERTGFLLVLEWFENFRLRYELPADRDAARLFWKNEVIKEDRPREAWQLDQWGDAIQWYLKWLDACAEAGADHRSLAERVRAAVYSACSRRGLERRTKQCYGAWGARFAKFAGNERKVIEVETATQFLTSVVLDEDCAYSTQKQALNALAGTLGHPLFTLRFSLFAFLSASRFHSLGPNAKGSLHACPR